MKRLLQLLRWRPAYALPAVLLILLALVLTGCETNTPQNTFDARGEVARDQRDLFYLAMWPAIAVMVLVMGVLVIALLRFRRRSPDELPKQVHGNTRLEVIWTVLPAVLLLALGIPMVIAIYDIGREPSKDAYPIKVTGIQWAWQFEYPEILGQDGKPVSTLGEVHIPVGREIGFTIIGADVIHSFWVPKLAGKLDAVPGEDNRMWMKADEPGSFSGQCAEFCGLGHSGMKLVLIAQSQADFDAWAREMQAGNKAAAGESAGAVAAAGTDGR